MSALQKYKQEAKRLAVENDALRERIESLEAECKILHEDGVAVIDFKEHENVEARFLDTSIQLTQELVRAEAYLSPWYDFEEE